MRGKVGRPSKAELVQREKDAAHSTLLEQIEKIAREGAPQAMQTLVAAAAGEPVRREVIAAAQYVINQVLGRPGDKGVLDNTEDEVLSLVRDIKQLRQQNLRTHATRDGVLVDEGEDRLPAVSRAVEDPGESVAGPPSSWR